MSTCQKNIDDIIFRSLKPVLKEEQYKKTGRTWHREKEGALQVVNVQSSMFGTSNEARFTVNVGCYHPAVARCLGDKVLERPKEYECMIRSRLGMLRPEGVDLWWTVTSETDPELIASEILSLWKKYGAPWIDSVTDIHRALEDEPRILGPRYILGLSALIKTPEETRQTLNRLLKERPPAAHIIKEAAVRLNIAI